MRNIDTLDRIIRLFSGVALIEVGFFWLAGGWQIAAAIAGALGLLSAALGFCPLYRLFGLHTAQAGRRPLGRWASAAITLLAIALLVVGGYASDFLTRKRFVEDFTTMNAPYKQALFFTGQSDRAQAVDYYDQLVTAYAGFQASYTSYQPYPVRGDAQFAADLAAVAGTIADAAANVHSGDLAAAHKQLETIRPLFQDIFKRNGFSMLSLSLVDFHDAMEQILDPATAKNPEQVLAIYPQVSAKLAAVEAEANDAEIQAIRANLDALRSLAERGATNALPEQASKLKSSFVKVYLVRG